MISDPYIGDERDFEQLHIDLIKHAINESMNAIIRIADSAPAEMRKSIFFSALGSLALTLKQQDAETFLKVATFALPDQRSVKQ